MKDPDDRPGKQPGNININVDIYGIKVDGLRPVPADEPDPESWADVRASVKSSLMKICINTISLINDSLTSARAFIRGVGNLPEAVNRRVSKSHDRAEKAEGKRQEVAETRQLPPPDGDKDLALENLQAYVDKLALEGVPVHMIQLEDGTLLVAALPRERLDEGVQLAKAALPPPDPAQPGLMSIPVETIVRPKAASALVKAGIRTAGDLAQMTRVDLLAVPGVGDRTYTNIVAALNRLGLSHGLGPVPVAGPSEAETT